MHSSRYDKPTRRTITEAQDKPDTQAHSCVSNDSKITLYLSCQLVAILWPFNKCSISTKCEEYILSLRLESQ